MAYVVGQIVEGKVTGIQSYGAFIHVDKHTTGLVHISELSDAYVKDIASILKVGDVLKLKVLEVDEAHKHLRLSLKATFNSRKSRPRLNRLPKLKSAIGFESLRNVLDTWIQVAQKEIKK